MNILQNWKTLVRIKNFDKFMMEPKTGTPLEWANWLWTCSETQNFKLNPVGFIR